MSPIEAFKDGRFMEKIGPFRFQMAVSEQIHVAWLNEAIGFGVIYDQLHNTTR
jgi:hypothetical protein